MLYFENLSMYILSEFINEDKSMFFLYLEYSLPSNCNFHGKLIQVATFIPENIHMKCLHIEKNEINV